MKRLLNISLLTILGFMMGACTQEDNFATRVAKEKTIELQVIAPGIEETGAATRSDKTDSEKKIHSLYVLQFSGTASTSTLAKYEKATLGADNKISFPFKLIDGSGSNRIYIVANVSLSVTADVTKLGDFENSLVSQSVSASVPAGGIPMCDVHDFDPVGQAKAPDFKLRAMVAKVTLNCSIDPSVANLFSTNPAPVITLKGTTKATTYFSPADYTAAYRPTGIAYNDPISLGGMGSYTYYVAENVAGQNSSVNRWIYRSAKNAPANATYFEIMGYTADGNSKVTITLFMGDPNNASDFNTIRNYHYSITANIMGLDEVDQRLTLRGDFMYVNDNGSWTDSSQNGDSFGN